jgi:hypothetical protein
MSAKPLFIIPTGSMSKADMTRVRAIGICCVECSSVSTIRFEQPPFSGNWKPSQVAALKLMKAILAKNDAELDENYSVRKLQAWFARILAEQADSSLK